MRRPFVFFAVALVTLFASALSAVDLDLGRETRNGSLGQQSLGALAFGPDGVLFVADSIGAAVYAIDTGEQMAAQVMGTIDVEAIDAEMASMMGTSADQVQILDLAVNPVSRRAFLSVSRGQGESTEYAIFSVGFDGKVQALDLDDVRHARASLPNAPELAATDRRGRPLRVQSITDLAFVDGRLLVTGLSNEEFASNLREIPFPFSDVSPGTSVEIFHGAHGRWETNAPIRTFTTYDIGTAPHVLAAYTCTPLVKFPLEELLESGAKVVGTTVAELGNRNRPLDMIVYSQDGSDYALMANSSRGVMKVELSSIEDVDPITERVADKAGLKYRTIGEWQGVEQLDRLDPDHALLLVDTGSGRSLRTVALP
jgi:hypothetical protein